MTTPPRRGIIGGPLSSEPGRFYYTTRHRKSQEKIQIFLKNFCFSRNCEKIHKLFSEKFSLWKFSHSQLTTGQLVVTNSDDGRWSDRHRIWQLFFRNSGLHMAPAKIPKHRLPAGACENFHKFAPIRNKTRQKTHMMKNYLQKSHLFWYNIKKNANFFKKSRKFRKIIEFFYYFSAKTAAKHVKNNKKSRKITIFIKKTRKIFAFFKKFCYNN